MIVVDASALVDDLSGAADTTALHDRLRAEELHAPHLIDYEVISAIRGLTLARQLRSERAEDLLGDLDRLPLRRWPAAHALRQRAFSLRHNISAYDAAYVCLAEALDYPLVTRDARLARSSGHDAEIEAL